MQTLNLFAAYKVKRFSFYGGVCIVFRNVIEERRLDDPPDLSHGDCAVTHDQTQTDDRSLQTAPNTVPSPNAGRRRR